MIQPVLSHQALLDDIDTQNAVGNKDFFNVWWLGQSGFLIQFDRSHLLFDPYLSDSLTRKYAETDKPHVRMTELCVDPSQLNFIDVVTSSHNHTDHLDAETLWPLMKANREISLAVPVANQVFAAERLKVDPTRLTPIQVGQPISFGPFMLTAVPAAHNEIQVDQNGNHHFIGIVAQFGKWAVYHSGDTLLYDDMIDHLSPFDIDLALLPINGNRPERRVAGNLFGREAAYLANEIGAGHVIPCHYDMFEFNTEPTEEFEEECKRLGVPYSVLKCGERWQSLYRS